MSAFAIGVDILLVLGLVFAFNNVSAWLGPRSVHEGDAEEPYETGLKPIEPAVEKMSVLYYRFAVLFVVFDVDLAFLLPWALTRGAVSLAGALAMSVFVALLALMLGYFWRKGVLECR